MDFDEMRRRVEAARVARLATLAADGTPHLVPFCFVLAGQYLYSAVDRKSKRTTRLQRLANVARDPRLSVLVDHYEEDWIRLWWVRLAGRGRELDRGGEADHALQLLTDKYPQYAELPPPGPVLRIEVERWSGWEAS
ncbi:MAG: TIGR03668 family PPOX class F420-dependent oxidoreductase [Candidatus Dormibacteraeota bacterium]|nr:TIGR03668 family PPOX class F420-dependent oxidoreductase [Candidatus Dormibacteraeota bacterium]